MVRQPAMEDGSASLAPGRVARCASAFLGLRVTLTAYVTSSQLRESTRVKGQSWVGFRTTSNQQDRELVQASKSLGVKLLTHQRESLSNR